MNPLDELNAVYADFIKLEKSRGVKKAKETGEDDPPADDDNMKQYDSDSDKDKDNNEEMDEQYGDTEPQDDADKAAQKKAARREKDLDKSLSTKEGRDEQKDIQECPHCGEELAKSDKFCKSCGTKLKKSKGSATKAIRDSQDAYENENGNDDDVHGETTDVGEEEGKGDDETIITNMGRRTRPGVKKSLTSRENFYGDLIKSTGFDGDFFDANPGVERMSDIVGDYLDASDRRVAQLTKSINALTKSQAALLRANMQMQQQIDAINEQPADIPQTGYVGWNAPVEDLAKSQAAKAKQGSKLTKSLVREKLHKGMIGEVVESHVLADFDNYMSKGYEPTQWVMDSLTDEQRQVLGL